MHKLNSFIVKLTIFSLVLGMFASVRPVFAVGEIQSITDKMSNQGISALSDHEILFERSIGVASGQTIVITFPSDFDGSIGDPQGALDFNDVDLIEDATGAYDLSCEDSEGAQETLVGSAPSSSQWSAVFTTTATQRVLTLTSGGASATIAADSDVCIEIGEQADGNANNYNAATPPAAGNSQYKNATTTGSKEIEITAGLAGTGAVAVPIVDNSTVSLTANVDAVITFDIDTGTSDGNTNSPYAVALGTLAAGTLTTSNQSSVNSIFFDLDTNASAGAVVTGRSLNQGLKSVAANPDKTIQLGSGEETIAAGSEEIGYCIESVTATTGTVIEGLNFDSGANACSLSNTGTQQVGRMDNLAGEIFTTQSNAIAGARVELLVKASITATTPAANDYSDTLTFIATGTF